MIDLLKKIFARSKKFEQQNFSKIMKDPKNIYFFLPEKIDLTTKLISKTYNWKDIFPEIHYILPEYFLPLFQKINIEAKLSSLENPTTISDLSVLFNFQQKFNVQRLIRENKNMIIIDSFDRSNIHFIPPPESPFVYIKKFADFFDIPIIEKELLIKKEEINLSITRNELIKNRFQHFLVMNKKKSASRKWSNFLHILKKEFAANIYLIRMRPIKEDFINLKHIECQNLLQLYEWASNTDLFFVDQKDIAKTFQQFGIKTVLIDERQEANIPTIEMQNEKEIIETISKLSGNKRKK